jgi:Flp pilus assembly pilin Flp
VRTGGEEAIVDRLKQWFIRILDTERGQDMVEYVLIVTFISVPVVLVAIVMAPSFALWAQTVSAYVTGAAG